MAKTEKSRKVLYYILMALSFLTVYLFTCITPCMSDDICSPQYSLSTLGQLFRDCYDEYVAINARQVTHFILRCVLSGPKWLFNILNGVVFVMTLKFMHFNVSRQDKYEVWSYLLIVVLVWRYGVSFGETILWETGSCNYLFGACIILGFITWFRYLLSKEEGDVNKTGALTYIGLFVLGILAGWCNENSSGGCLLIIGIYSIIFYLEKKKIKPWMVVALLGNLVGLAFLVLAPGNRNRSDVMGSDEEHTGLLMYVGRFLKIKNVFRDYYMVMLIIITVLIIYGVLKGIALVRYKNCFIFLMATFATSFVLILIPSPMDRAHFCSGLFLTIACVEALTIIPKEDFYLDFAKYSGIAVLTILMTFEYIDAGANLTRIYREIQERDAIVAEQVAEGKDDIIAPMIRPEWQNRFTFIYRNDLEEDPDSWGGYLNSKIYGVNSVTGIPRDKWDEEH